MKHESDRPQRKAVALDPHPLCHTALSTLLARFDIDLVGAATTTGTTETLLHEHRPGPARLGGQPARRARRGTRDHLGQPGTVSGADGDRSLGHRRSVRDRRRVRLRSVRLRPEDVGPGGDRDGDPAGVRAVALSDATARPDGAGGRQRRPAQADPSRARDPGARFGRDGRTARSPRSSGSPTRR